MHVPRLDFGLSQQLCLHSWWVSQNLISCKKSAYSAEIIPCVDWQEWMSGGGKLVRVSTLPRSFTFHSIFSHFCVSQAELKITKDRQWWSYIIVLRAARRVKKDIAIKTNPKYWLYNSLWSALQHFLKFSEWRIVIFSFSDTHLHTLFLEKVTNLTDPTDLGRSGSVGRSDTLLERALFARCWKYNSFENWGFVVFSAALGALCFTCTTLEDALFNVSMKLWTTAFSGRKRTN